MDIGTVIGLVALAISILGTLFSLLYTRRRTKIMEEQLRIVREGAEKKRAFGEVSKAIREAIKMTKKPIDSGYFHFFPLNWSRDQILAYMHDNNLEKLELHIKPRSLTTSDQKTRDVKIRRAEDLMETIKGWLDITKYSYSGGGLLTFDCEPDILQNPDVDLGDPFSGIKTFYHAHRILESHQDLIDAFDDLVLRDLKETIDAIVRVIFESTKSEHKIVFSSTDKSEEILRRLEKEIVGQESIQRLLQKLSLEICDGRLSALQKEMFLKS